MGLAHELNFLGADDGGEMKSLILVFISFVSLSAFAGTSTDTPTADAPKTFVQWKELKVNAAQNRVVRLSNALLLLKTERYSPRKVLPEVAAESKGESTEAQQLKMIEKTEKQLSSSIERLEFTRDLSIHDYFSVYLKKYSGDKSALEKVALSLSPAETSVLLQTLIDSKPKNPEVGINQPLVEAALATKSPKSKTPSKM